MTRGHRAVTKDWCVALALLAAGCIGCVGPDAVEVVEFLPDLELMEELRIGSVDDPDVGFSRIGAVDVGADGSVYVVESQDREVRAYSPDGRLLRRIGGAGEGPGEFGAAPSRMGIRGDTLWVTDMRLRRMTLFTIEGAVMSTLPIPVTTGLLNLPEGVTAIAASATLRPDGMIHLAGWVANVFLDVAPVIPDSLDLPVVRVDRGGQIADTVSVERLYLVKREDEEEQLTVDGRTLFSPAQTNMMLNPGPPSDTPLRMRASDGGIQVMRRAMAEAPNTFVIARMSERGDTIYSRSLGYSPVPFSPSFVDSLTAARGPLDFPPHQPAVADAFVGADGTVLLRREWDVDGDPRWLVIAPDGEPVGHFSLPTTSVIRWVGDGRLYVAEPDEFGVPWLIRYAYR